MLKIAVIAGTPVDTQMGVDYINSRSTSTDAAQPVYLPVSSSCDEQLQFQYASYEVKRQRIDEIFLPAIEDGIRHFFIYCNSLSGAFDFDTYEGEISERTGKTIHIYTPLQVYRKAGTNYTRLGVMAAHNLSAYTIEKTIMDVNDIYVIGTGNMALVSAIERGVAPGTIVSEFHLADLASYMAACGCQALILGCTHFPYFKEELARVCSIPLIDPADEMYNALLSDALQ